MAASLYVIFTTTTTTPQGLFQDLLFLFVLFSSFPMLCLAMFFLVFIQLGLVALPGFKSWYFSSYLVNIQLLYFFRYIFHFILISFSSLCLLYVCETGLVPWIPEALFIFLYSFFSPSS